MGSGTANPIALEHQVGDIGMKSGSHLREAIVSHRRFPAIDNNAAARGMECGNILGSL